MTFPNDTKIGAATSAPGQKTRTNVYPTATSKPLFAPVKDLAAGVRLLIFLCLLSVPAAALFITAHAHAHKRIPQQITITPFVIASNDAIVLLVLCCAVSIMAKLERRNFSEYGLPLRQAFRRDFWIGSLMGFLTISMTLAAMFLLHGFRILGLAIHGITVLSSVTSWGLAFILAGLLEEFAFRGYIQYTLGSGIGFWPAALVMSGLFGVAHLADKNETLVGSAVVVLFGLLLCLFLRRTGNLWCAVGFHAAYDWGQTFFYGVPDSGVVPYHNLFHSVLTGPTWLTGGIVGPEASVLTPMALLGAALAFSCYYRPRTYRAKQAAFRAAAAS